MPCVLLLIAGAQYPKEQLIADALEGRQAGGAYLKFYDPDGHNGRGTVRTCRRIQDAMRFADAGAALECWRRQSTVRPLRTDGKPNRPLTAYHAEIVNLPEETCR